MIDALNKELAEDPNYDFERNVGNKDSFFNMYRDDVYDANQKGKKLFNLILKNG